MKVRIKPWKELAQEYGSTNEGLINTKGIPSDVST